MYKLILASFTGSLYVIVLFLPELHILYSFIFKIIVSIIMVFIAFTPREIKKFLKLIFLFYTEAFILGGGIIGFFYLIYGDINTLDSVFLLSKISTKFIILGSFIASLFVKIGFDIFENYYKEKEYSVELEIYINGKSCKVNGLIDTGNHLRDPRDGTKVIVTYINALKDIVSKDEIYNIGEVKENSISSNIASRIRIIPYKAVGVENGMLTGIKTDLVLAKSKNKVKANKDVTIAFHDKSFLGGEGYDAIAYPEILS